jgi:nitrite reductase/ring-hydroxylating ferredoxin subunit
MKSDASKILNRNIFQRLFGKCATREPENQDCWTYSDNRIEIDLHKAPELSNPGGAFRLERDDLPEQLLVIHGDDGNYYAFQNRCTHGKRRLDPVPGAGTVQCCSIGKSTFDYSGNLLAGSAKSNVTVFPTEVKDGKLEVSLL